MTTWRTLASVLAAGILTTATTPDPAWSQDQCSALDEIIEAIPTGGRLLKGDTCGKPDTLSMYNSPKCRIPQVDYLGGEVIYRLRLNEGNQVAFFLEVQGKADLVLALLDDCGNGNQCVNSSADFIGTKNEEISAAQYKAGIYYLYVDTWKDKDENENKDPSCGPYELTISGINPSPSLSVEMTSRSLAAIGKAVAGQPLTYELKVTNTGGATAHNVVATFNMSSFPDIDFLSADREGCTRSGSTISCPLPDIPPPGSQLPDPKASVTLNIKVSVTPKAAIRVRSTADVRLDSGISAHADLFTPVDHVNDLSVKLSAPTNEAIAGKRRTYTLTLHNDGPSDATEVQATDTLDENESFVESIAPADGCFEAPDKKHVICTVSRIAAHGTELRSFAVTTKPSATALSHTAIVGTTTGKEPKPNLGSNSARIDTPLGREADLAIIRVETRRKGQIQAEPIPAGLDFDYAITVKNLRYSNSSGSTLEFDPVDDDLLLCDPNKCEPQTVRVLLGPLASGDDRTLLIPAKTLPSFLAKPLSINAQLIPTENEKDTDGLNNLRKIQTSFKIEPDLELTGGIPTTVSNTPLGVPVCATVNLLYTFQVSNNGPSNSRGGEIQDTLPEGLSFVSSPDRCTFDDAKRTVSCPIPALTTVDDPQSFRFVAAPSTEITKTVSNKAKVIGFDKETNTGNDELEVPTTITPESDLTVTMDVSQEIVEPGRDLVYTVNLTNRGPSTRTGAKISFLFDPSITPTTIETETETGCTCNIASASCTCDIDANKNQRITITLSAPGLGTTVKASASVTTEDCDSGEIKSGSVTTTVADDDADLAVMVKADRDVAVARDLLRYTVELATYRFAQDPQVKFHDDLPAGVSDVKVSPMDGCNIAGLSVTCPIVAGQPRTLTVLVSSPPGHTLENTVHLDGNPDLNPSNNHASISLPVVKVAPLVLPVFEVAEGGSPVDLTTLYSVRNLDSKEVKVRYDYPPVIPSPDPSPIPLLPNASRTANLHDSGFLLLRGEEGYVGITPESAVGDERHVLTGDFIRIDPGRGSANGERLISTDTSRIPPELCESWSVRFLRDLPPGSSTDLLFFAPGNTGGVVAKGKAFAKSGAFLQEEGIQVESTQEAFRVSINSTDDSDLKLLASSGSIEWTFQRGLVGNVTAVHKLGGKDEIAVPGFCRSTRNPGGSSLLLPFFEVDRSRDDAGLTTLLAFRNETNQTVTVTPVVHFQKDDGTAAEQQTELLMLDGYETHMLDLRDTLKELNLNTVSQGYVTLETAPPAVLSGDFIRVGPEGRSGAALVDIPSELCRYWGVRFVRGMPPGTETRFLFYLQGNGSPTGTVYKEDGLPPLGEAETPSPQFPSFLVSLSDLVLAPPGFDLGNNGWIDWDLGEDTLGHVAMLFTGGTEGQHYSVLIPGTCLDTRPPGN